MSGHHFLCYRELINSSVVSHAITAQLTNYSTPDLVLVRLNKLEIYQVVHLIDDNSSKESTNNDNNSFETRDKDLEISHNSFNENQILKLVESFPLSGVVVSISKIQFDVTSYRGTAFLLTFDEAKVSLVGYSHESRRLVTLSLHRFEEDSIGPGAGLHAERTSNILEYGGLSATPIAKLDPQDRCAAMLIYKDQLVIIPFNNQSNQFIGDENENGCDEYNDDSVRVAMSRLNKNGMLSNNHTTDGEKAELIGRPFILNLSKLGVKGTIRDLCFLDMYLEPTLMVLYESETSSSGRFSAVRDNCVLSVFSINLSQRLHPEIWSRKDLPYDCTQLIPVPNPTGGVILISTNAIMYFNQSKYAGISLNDFGKHTVNCSKYSLSDDNEKDKLSIRGEITSYDFLSSNEIIFSHVSGNLYSLYMDFSGISNKKLQLMMISSSIHTSCMCILSQHNLIFLGSRTGDSLLISYKKSLDKCQEKKNRLEFVKEEKDKNDIMSEESASKRRRTEDGKVDVDSDDEEDLLLYGNNNSMESTILNEDILDVQIHDPLNKKVVSSFYGFNYQFEVVDSLINIGHIVSFTTGKKISMYENEENKESNSKDVVICGGQHRDGSISIIHQGLHPIVGTEADLDGCRAMWTVKDVSKSSLMDSYLILSLTNNTLILETGEGMEPIETDHGFFTDGPTLCVGNLFNNERIVQVFREGVRLIHRMECTQELTIDDSIDLGGLGIDANTTKITLVDILDPYVLICLSDGTLRLIVGDIEDMEMIASIPSLKRLDKEDPVTAASLFHDTLDLSIESSPSISSALSTNNTIKDASTHIKQRIDNNEEEEEDDDLYGAERKTKKTIANKITSSMDNNNIKDSSDSSSSWNRSLEKIVCCVVCRESGTLEIYQLPNFQLIGHFPSFSFGPQLLPNTISCSENIKLGFEDTSSSIYSITKTPVADILIHRVGPNSSSLDYVKEFSKLVLLGFLASGDLLIYTAKFQNRISLFERVHTDSILRPYITTLKSSKDVSKTKSNQLKNTQSVTHSLRAAFRYPMLSRFENIGGKSGVFFRGVRPAYILSDRSLIHIVPMSMESKKQTKKASVPILCFTPFHNINCPKGFIYFHSSGTLRVCQLPEGQFDSTGRYYIRKISMECTPHQICSLGNIGYGGVHEALQTPTYAVILSHQIPWIPDEHDDEEELITDGEQEEEIKQPELLNIDGSNHIPTIYEDVYELRLIQANTWDPKGVFTLKLNKYEVGLSMELMYLSDTSKQEENTIFQWKEKRKPFLVIGTGFVTPHGEDTMGKGRLLVYEVDYAQYTTDSGEVGEKVPKLKLVYEKVHRQGAVTEVAQMGPYVLAAIGPKIIVHELKSDQLIGCAFFDARVYIVSLKVIKDFILFGDIYDSIQMLRWKEQERSLILLAKDYDPLSVYSTEFSINDRTLGLVAADAKKNINVFHFAPQDVDSRGGQRLLIRSDFHVGSIVSCMKRQRMSSLVSKQPNQFINLLATLDGSMGALVPVAEGIFRRLFTLQTIMTNALYQNAGLNPREFRLCKLNHNQLRGVKKGIIDGAILWRYCHLDQIAQMELARCIGTTPDIVIQNMLEIELGIVFQG